MECPQYSFRLEAVGHLFTSCSYFLHSTMPSVTCLRLSVVNVIYSVTYFSFSNSVCFSSMSVSQAAQPRTCFNQYRTSDVAENLGTFLVRIVQPRGMILN